jgi:putative transposase
MEHRFQWNAGLRNNRSLHQVWTDDNHAEEIWSRKFFDQKLNYIHMNPVTAGWVHEPEHWRYSSAADALSATPMVHLSFWE